jgi:hypothetical protein
MWMSCTGEDEEEEDPANSTIVIWGKRLFGDRMLTHYEGSAFWVYVDGVGRYKSNPVKPTA